MTDNQKKMVAEYRQAGYSYTQISEMMEVSINSIKTYCKRHALGGTTAYIQRVNAEIKACENCGKEVIQNPGRKVKRFCSDRCRNQWWNKHQDQVSRKANYEYVCPCCKKSFVAYGNAYRKFCSHSCYVQYRFGGEINE